MAETDKPADPPEEVPTNAELSEYVAAFFALWRKDIDFYPRVVVDGKAKSVKTKDVVLEALSASESWSRLKDATALEAATKLARESLTEVTKQTEYQDQKATRLLTVTTFLSAFAGVLFTRFQDSYPVHYPIFGEQIGYASIVIALTYLTFIAFVMSALLGALIIFHATRTRFKYPPSAKTKSAAPPTSLLFHMGIIRAKPKTWMDTWVEEKKAGDASSEVVIHSNLKIEYFRNLVLETYLVAAKIGDKLRYLQPAQNLLAWSMRILVGWLVLLMVTVGSVPSTKPAAKPTEIKLTEPIALPAPNVVVQLPSQPPASPAPKPRPTPEK